ncbi:MAG: hypothetical protein RB296_12355 [Acidobacteriota bacterium]|jgi:hypothetical protein|nr:hypothetical protein [Acidobacteriota bacterium]
MNQKLIQLEYRRGMLTAGMQPDDLPIRIWKEEEVPTEALALVYAEGLLELGGVYGDPDMGDPVEYDYLRLVLGNHSVEITVFNRGITLFTSDDEKVISIHRVLSKLID